MPVFDPKIRRVNASRIKTAFVSEVLRETAELIRSEQSKVADEWDLFESGTLRSWLQGHFSVANQDGGGKLSMRYLVYARFLDMPDARRTLRRAKQEGYSLYNRTVFGILYNRSFNILKWGLTQDVYEQIATDIDKAMTDKMPFYKRRDYQLGVIAKEDRYTAAIVSKRMRQGYGY